MYDAILLHANYKRENEIEERPPKCKSVDKRTITRLYVHVCNMTLTSNSTPVSCRSLISAKDIKSFLESESYPCSQRND